VQLVKKYQQLGRARIYEAKITVNNKVICLGCYETLEKAALAYNEGALKYFGEFAQINDIQELTQ
jgi:hypothetical protein